MVEHSVFAREGAHPLVELRRQALGIPQGATAMSDAAGTVLHMHFTVGSAAPAQLIDSQENIRAVGIDDGVPRVSRALVTAGLRMSDHDTAVYLVASGMAVPGFEERFPVESTRVDRLRARFEASPNGRIALETIRECAPGIAAEQLGSLYQLLRVPRVRAANAAAYSGEEKLAGSSLLLVTQFFTDTYLADWLAARTLEGLDPDRLVVSDPCVGGGALLVVAYRRLLNLAHETARVGVSDRLLTSDLRGYDLDPVMAGISRLALWVEASRSTRRVPPVPSRITSGGHRVLGSLDHRALRPLVPEDGERLVFLTNPPFLGRRLMDDVLRAELRRRFRTRGMTWVRLLSGIYRRTCVSVTGSGWFTRTLFLHLTTLEALRQRVLDRCSVRDAADLGPSAFERLTGDKARVTLSVLEAIEPGTGPNTVWPDPRLDVSRLRRADKVEALRRDLAVPAVKVIQPSSAARTATPTRQLRGLAACHSNYSSFARPMQGSSTGDNARFVRFVWEVPAADSDWVEASKGGGYAKWWGLRRYVVRWGRDGDLLRGHPGSALRNPGEARRAHLVWSDTGTAGLNVRVRPSAAVFIASGPGILVNAGDPVAHAAVLNSRLISAYLRWANPKLSLTPGALARVPFPSAALEDARLVELATRAIAFQQQFEAERVDALDWGRSPLPVGEDPLALIDRRWRADVEREVERLCVEREIEDRVEELFEVDEHVLAEVRELVGESATRLGGSVKSSADELLIDYARALGPTLRYRGGLRSMMGCDGPVEALSQHLGLPAHDLAERLLTGGLHPAVLTRYFDDLLHQAVLDAIGFTPDRSWTPRSLSRGEVGARLTAALGAPRSPVDGHAWDWWLNHRLPALHTAAFRRPSDSARRGRTHRAPVAPQVRADRATLAAELAACWTDLWVAGRNGTRPWMTRSPPSAPAGWLPLHLQTVAAHAAMSRSMNWSEPRSLGEVTDRLAEVLPPGWALLGRQPSTDGAINPRDGRPD